MRSLVTSAVAALVAIIIERNVRPLRRIVEG